MRHIFFIMAVLSGYWAFAEWRAHDNELAFIVMNIYAAAVMVMGFIDLKKQPTIVKAKNAD